MVVHRREANFTEASAQLQHALEIFVEIGDVRGQASTLNELGLVNQREDPLSARRCHLMAMRLARSSGNLRHEAQAWLGLGEGLIANGDIEKGIRRLNRALELYRRMNDQAALRIERRVAGLRA